LHSCIGGESTQQSAVQVYGETTEAFDPSALNTDCRISEVNEQCVSTTVRINDVQHELVHQGDDADTTPSTPNQPVYQMCMAQLIKFRHVHRLTLNALSDIVQFTKVLHQHYVRHVQSEINDVYERADSVPDLDHLLDCVDIMHPLEGIDTEHQLQKQMLQNLFYVKPDWISVGSYVGSSKGKLVDRSDGFFYVPLLSTVESLLSNKHIYNQVVFGPHQSNGAISQDVCDGSLFKSHPVFKKHPNALQIIAYYDEFTAVSQVSSVSKLYKIGALYFTLANIDPALRSKVEAINLLCLFPYNLMESYSFDDILKPFIEEVEQLSQHGYTFHVDGEEVCLHGDLVAFLGDTPAAAKVGGFKEGVGFADKKCRHCMATNNQIQSKFFEEEFTMRTLSAHLTHCTYLERPGITADEKSHYSKVYGINRRSTLCNLSTFDVTQQLPQDIMHLLFEGLFPVHVDLILHHAIDTLGVRAY
jgi:hypothetical protein